MRMYDVAPWSIVSKLFEYEFQGGWSAFWASWLLKNWCRNSNHHDCWVKPQVWTGWWFQTFYSPLLERRCHSICNCAWSICNCGWSRRIFFSHCHSTWSARWCCCSGLSRSGNPSSICFPDAAFDEGFDLWAWCCSARGDRQCCSSTSPIEWLHNMHWSHGPEFQAHVVAVLTRPLPPALPDLNAAGHKEKKLPSVPLLGASPRRGKWPSGRASSSKAEMIQFDR